MRRRLVIVIAASLLVVISGCSTGHQMGGQPATESPPVSETTNPPETSAQTCNESTVPYDLTPPSKPDDLTKETAETTVERFDERYAIAYAKTMAGENATVRITGRKMTTRRISDGFDITITTKFQISDEDFHAKLGYPTTYRVTDGVFERHGTTFSCW